MADETAAKPPKAKKARKPKPEATSEDVAEKRARAAWTRDKLDMLQAALHDPRMNGGRFRLFAYILQCTNYRSRVAVVHDEQIMDEVPGFGDDETIRRNRVQIRKIGWWDYIPGRAVRSTVYSPHADPIEGVMSLVRIKAEARGENHAYRKEALRTGKETLQQQHQTTNEMRGKRIKRSPQNAGETSCENEGITPSLTPAGSGQRATRRSQDVELRPVAVTPLAEVMSCPGCGVVAEAGIAASGRCADCESDALRGELLDRQLLRSQSGKFLCIDCGTETRLVARYESEPFYPFCAACIEANEFPDVKPIADQPSYAEVSRGG